MINYDKKLSQWKNEKYATEGNKQICIQRTITIMKMMIDKKLDIFIFIFDIPLNTICIENLSNSS